MTQNNSQQLFTGEEFTRIANNFYNSKNLVSDINRISIDAELSNYLNAHQLDAKKKSKVAFIWICLNAPYWQFAKPMINGAKQFFLPGHDVDYLLWSDIPEIKERITEEILKNIPPEQHQLPEVQKVIDEVSSIRQLPKVTIFPIESIEWPMPTLLRYHTFLQQEELLKTYDYIFYCDVDMVFQNIVGDEILGEGLTATMNPMYALQKNMWMPYEPNPQSTAYIPRPGQLVNDNGQPRFMPQYYAGGFQGGKSDKFLEAMKVMKKNIDTDLNQLNYIAIWNEESHWNRYLFDHPENLNVLNQSYVYPDSLHKEYYIPRWGQDYQPKLVTLTKKFSLRQLSPEELA